MPQAHLGDEVDGYRRIAQELAEKEEKQSESDGPTSQWNEQAGGAVHEQPYTYRLAQAEALYNALGHECTQERTHSTCCNQQAQEDGWRAYLTDYV